MNLHNEYYEIANKLCIKLSYILPGSAGHAEAAREYRIAWENWMTSIGEKFTPIGSSNKRE